MNSNISDERLSDWLKSDKNSICFNNGRHNYNFIKVEREPNIDIIFSMCTYDADKIGTNQDFEYAGVYNKLDGKIYDFQSELRAYHDFSDKVSLNDICEDIELAVAAEVEKRVGNDTANILFPKDIESRKSELEKEEFYTIKSSVRKLYLNDNNEVNYKCEYSISDFEDDEFFRALTDRTAFVNELSENYTEKNNSKIADALLINDIIKEKLSAQYENSDNTLYNLKQIINCVNNCDSKTVNVTTSIDGKNLTFKMNADALRTDCGKEYDIRYIPSKDRQGFIELYGCRVELTPDDIIEISSGKKILYEKDNNMKIEQEITDNDDGFSMGMT